MPSDDAFNFFTWKDMLCQKWKIAVRRAHWVLDRLHQLSRLNSLLVIETWWFSTAPLVMWLLLEHREPQSLVSFKSLQSRQMCKKSYIQYILCDNKQQQYVLKTYFWTVTLHLFRDMVTWNWRQLKRKRHPHSVFGTYTLSSLISTAVNELSQEWNLK